MATSTRTHKLIASFWGKNLKLKAEFLPQIIKSKSHKPASYLVICDTGETRGQEYNEYTDIIRKLLPQTQIIIATPVIPQTEEAMLKDASDRLITLHIEPLFFSLSQFYSNQK